MRYFYGVMKDGALEGEGVDSFFNTEGKILVERIREDLLMEMIFKQKNSLVLVFYVKDSTCVT